MTVAELIEQLQRMPQDAPVRTVGEVVTIEKTTYYGDVVVYLYGDQE